MKRLLIILTLGVSIASFGMRSPGSKVNNANSPTNGNNAQKSAACAPSSEFIYLEFNNVKALIETGGSMWQNRANNTGAYFVPKDGDASSIYSGALWMGGTDVNGQLKLAAHLFRADGTDFWPGPLEKLTNPGNYNPNSQIFGAQQVVRDNGAATIGDPQCITYDRFWSISKADVIQYNAAYESIWNPDIPEIPVDPEVLDRIVNWPAHPFESGLGQDRYLAPFFDRNGDGIYQPNFEFQHGDYPWYDLSGDIDCEDDRRVVLFGDYTNWWVFNDRGNIHSETGGDPIGLEVRAQAFAFATSDEINNMTFYNYEVINRGTQTLENTFFSQFVDPDLGGSTDDYVGCDVSRGLSFAYNGDDFDQTVGAAIGYGDNPPAVGVDFFEGPYQDNDGIDNPGPIQDSATGTWTIPSVSEAIALKGIVYPGIGIGYGDGIIDNERFGMRRFTYFNRSDLAIPGVNDDPETAPEYYQYMTGYWKNNSHMKYGGIAVPGQPGVTTIDCDYMFPGDSDSLNWGTAGIDPGFDWSEESSNNPPADRRFVQSAGPFTLEPGAVNNITVGVVWARATGGNAFESVTALKIADTKAQALFDACFRIVEPPQAPELKIQELENELVLYLSNPLGSNNYNEEYIQEDDVNIPAGNDRFYRFEGYQIYQMVDEEASVTDIGDLDKARLVAQCDIQNQHTQLVNWTLNEETNVLNSEVMTFPNDGENIKLNQGIRHSFRITDDQFATGAKTLVNHKTYYYIAIAYGVNQFKLFQPGIELGGQQTPYLNSRLSYNGGGIEAVSGIPHNPMPEADGTFQMAAYGSGPEITRVEGTGNGGRFLNYNAATLETIVNNNSIDFPTYSQGSGPIDVKIVDPLNVAEGHFVLEMTNASEQQLHDGDVNWNLHRYDTKGGTLLETVSSERTIKIANEQIIPDWGISVDIKQESWHCYDGNANCSASFKTFNPIGATIEFADSSKRWLIGVQDSDEYYPTNWISVGTDNENSGDDCTPDNQNTNPCNYNDYPFDPEEEYENLLGGTVAPFWMVNMSPDVTGLVYGKNSFFLDGPTNNARLHARLQRVTSIDLVVTPDKSKWTRVSVVEMGKNTTWTQGGADFLELRDAPSVDKNGLSAGEPGYNAAEGGLVSASGMSWFPGYAIDLQTGERLNIIMGENSIYPEGRDMVFNPSRNFADPNGAPIFGGGHNIYVMRTGKATRDAGPLTADGQVIPNYSDNGQWIFDKLNEKTSASYGDVWKMCSWVFRPMLAPQQDLLSTEVTVKLRVEDDYNRYVTNSANNGYPMYEWSMRNEATVTDSETALADALKQINVVPNPYYGYSQYERNRVDNRIKVVNIPERCEVKIFNVRGKLIRTFKKDDPLTSIDWDLKNEKGIPIASGVYLIHVDVPGVGERILKWFGGLREPDLQNL